MMKILALVPVKRNMHPKLRLRCFDNVLAMQSYFQGQMDVYLDFRGPGDAMITDFRSLDRLKNLADVRQGMVNDYLRPDHTHVLMIDADVAYTPKTVTDLLRTSKTDIVAPAVYIEDTGAWDQAIPRREWYDTWGFIDAEGTRVNIFPPYFDMPGPIVPMSCVGTMYLVPAELFRQGAQYQAVDGFVDHLSICAFARNAGRKVLCNLGIIVQHPRLTDYGEKRG